MGSSSWPLALLASPHRIAAQIERPMMAVCVGYFNPLASRSEYSVSGFVSPKARWRALEERWIRTLRQEHVSAFNGNDFARRTGAFANGWHDEARRRRFLDALSNSVRHHVAAGFTCTIALSDYEAINRDYLFAETIGGPYALCCARIIARVHHWTAMHHPDDLTLFVFEDGEVEQRELRRILHAEGQHQGEPPQMWPRQWVDERGRQRYLRAFEACDLLLPATGGRLAEWLDHRGAWDVERVDGTRLLDLCERAAVARRPSVAAVS